MYLKNVSLPFCPGFVLKMHNSTMLNMSGFLRNDDLFSCFQVSYIVSCLFWGRKIIVAVKFTYNVKY